uniref:ENTH domain-containing protein C794.11c n=1 Tax=Anthurium amnicola TaxID=1678845 RepID=A0A1D1Z9W8_9ARAE
MDQLNNITLWDVKDVFNKVKNVVMNYTEMEAKVREATNNEPWGASSTLMQEIAQGTYNYTSFNEIMPTIYKRFTEKEARQWRQIYKALQLLEYLVKHGSERVVDDARAHMATIKIMRNFSYIDEKGKDQGINVRNRAKELAELLIDIEKIRQERKKAKANRLKFTGVSSDAIGYSGGYSGSFNGGSSRYGGFGNDSYDYSERSRYDDYDTSDYRTGRTSPPDDRRSSLGNNNRSSISSLKKTSETSESINGSSEQHEQQKQQKEVNLFDFDDPPITSATSNQTISNDFDDDFQDFQSAPPLMPSSQRSSISLQSSNLTGLQNNSVPPTISNLKLVQPTSNVQSSIQPNVNVSSGINNNLLDDFLGPVSTPQSTNLSINTPKSASTSLNTSQPINTFNISKPISPTTPKQNPTNQNAAFPNLKSNDIWASNLVSLDSLGKEPNNTKQAAKPTMNSLAQADSTSWAVKGTWTNAQAVQQPINHNTQLNSQQKQQDSFDLLM